MIEISMQHEIVFWTGQTEYLFYRVMTYPSYIPDTDMVCVCYRWKGANKYRRNEQRYRRNEQKYRRNEKTLKIHSTLTFILSSHSSQVTCIKQSLERPICIYLVVICIYLCHTITI